MGIYTLQDYIIGASYKTNISKIKPTDIAIDASIWICQLASEHEVHIKDMFIQRLNRWRGYGHKLIVVFDGDDLPGKKHTRDKRNKARLRRVQKLYDENKHDRAEKLDKQISQRKSTQKLIIKELREQKIDYIVAPFEADSQLAYLNKIGTVEYVITEDTDLALLCDKVIFKYNGSEGSCRIFQKIYLKPWLEELIGKHNDNFENTFMLFSILLGCDYVPNIPKLGPVTLTKVFKENPQIKSIQDMINSPVLKELNITVPDDYLEKYQMAEMIFKHAYAYDPFQRKRLPLNPYPENFDPSQHSYLGDPMPSAKRAKRHALGEIFFVEDPDFDPTTAGYDKKSIWIRPYPVPIKNITCACCGIRFESNYLLDPHYNIHLGYSPIKCRVMGCEFRAVNEDDIAKHFAAYHSERVRNKKCPICNKVIICSLEQHQKRRHKKKILFRCELCKFAVVSKYTKQHHKKFQHPNGETLYCETCKRQYTSLKRYRVHIRKHQLGVKYTCPKRGCNKLFLTKHELNKHVIYHDETPKCCLTCKKEFTKLAELHSHNYYHTSGLIECLICKEKDIIVKEKVKSVRMHIFHKHENFSKTCTRDGCQTECNDAKTYEKHLEEKHLERSYYCYFPDCGKEFKIQEAFQDHDKKHYMDPKVTFPEHLIVKVGNLSEKVECPNCQKMLTKHYLRFAHKCKNQDLSIVQKLLPDHKKVTCPDCNREMTRSHFVKKHSKNCPMAAKKQN